MNRVMMHHHNLAQPGGVPTLITDIMKAFPEFRHVIFQVHDQGHNSQLLSHWVSKGAEVGHLPLLTREVYDHWKPTFTILHNSRKKRLGSGIFRYFRHYPTIQYYHSVYNSGFDPGITIFASKYTFNRIRASGAKYKFPMIVPPLIDTRMFERIERPDAARCCIGHISSARTEGKFPQMLLDVMRKVGRQLPDTTFSIIGGEHFYGPAEKTDVPRLVMPHVAVDNQVQLFSDVDILLYMTKAPYAETWGRVITEAMAAGLPCVAEARGAIPEQIDHGKNGFLCRTHGDFVKYTLMLATDPKLRKTMGAAAREKACSEFGLSNLRRRLSDALIRSMGVL